MCGLLCNIDIIIYWLLDLGFIRTASVLPVCCPCTASALPMYWQCTASVVLPPQHKTVLISDNFGVINVLKTLVYYFLLLFSFQSRILHFLEKVSAFYETYLPAIFPCYS